MQLGGNKTPSPSSPGTLYEGQLHTRHLLPSLYIHLFNTDTLPVPFSPHLFIQAGCIHTDFCTHVYIHTSDAHQAALSQSY